MVQTVLKWQNQAMYIFMTIPFQIMVLMVFTFQKPSMEQTMAKVLKRFTLTRIPSTGIPMMEF